jgi:hypothetical protein
MKNTMSVVLGYVVWTSLWLGGNAGLTAVGVLRAEPAPAMDDVGALIALLVVSAVCSFCAGWTLGRVAIRDARVPFIALSALLIASGIFFQSQVWHLMPLWYHVTFLLLLVPVTAAGKRVGVPARVVS